MVATDARRKSAPATEKRSTGRTSTDHIETEWQFEADDLAAVEEWLKHRPPGKDLFIEPKASKDVRDTYLDTEDRRVHRAGYALRVRETDGAFEATMKSLTSGNKDGTRRRREISEPLKDAAALLRKTTGPVSERLRALTGGPSHKDHAPRPLFEVRTQRSVFELRNAPQDANGDSVMDASGNVRPLTPEERAVGVGEVALDATEITVGDNREPALLLRRVEVETEGDPSPLLKQFVEALRDALKLEAVLESKYEAGLAFSGLTSDPAPDFGPTTVKRSMPTGAVAFAVLRGQLAEMQAHEPGARLGEDPEELHDMRVATRRMRAAMKLFEEALPEKCRRFREELKFFAGILGEVRDLDVQIADERDRAERTAENDQEPVEQIVDALEKERTEARKALLETLDSERYERFGTYLAAMLREGPKDESAAEPIAVAGLGLISSAHGKWLKAAKRLKEDSPPEAYHDLRKKGKRLRYALEFLSGVYGKKRTAKVIASLKEVQDVFGVQQDAIVAAERLRSLAVSRRRLTRATVFEMGVHAERRLREADAARSGFTKSNVFKTLTKGKAWKDFAKEMRGTVKKARK